MKRKILLITAILYTFINLKFLWPFIVNNDLVLAAGLNSNDMTFLALFVGLFLNASFIIYLLKNNTDLV